MSPRKTIVIGDPHRVAVSVVRPEFWSSWILLTCASGSYDRAELPSGLHTQIGAGLPDGALAIAGVFARAPQGEHSRLVVPNPTILSSVRQVRAYHESWTPEHIRQSVVPAIEGQVTLDGLPSQSHRAGDNLGEWVRVYLESMAAIPSIFGQRWRDARAMLDREADRVAIAAASGRLGQLLDGLSSRLRFSDGELSFDSTSNRRFELGNRRLVLAPLIGPAGSLVTDNWTDDHVIIAYPVAAAADMLSRGPAEDRLSRMLGPQRAAILRVLETPMPMSDLAERLGTTASTTTFHCNHLESARLIQRRRQSNRVNVHITAKGRELIALMIS